jgi:type I restriction enzyme M protein
MRDYTKYYTPKKIAELMIDLCTDIQPESAIDICAGTWNLLNAAKKNWPEIKLTGVDNNPALSKSYCIDGRIFATDSYYENKKFDLVLANPPFGYECFNSEINERIIDIFGCKFGGSVLSRLESTMLLFNTILVKKEGVLVSVVPTSIISAENQISLRKYLGNNFFVEKIIELPENAFGSSNIRTSIIILRKDRSKKNTEMLKVIDIQGKYNVFSKGFLLKSKVELGEWTLETEIIKYKKINNLMILRNDIPTNKMNNKGLGHPVIHNSSITEQKVNHTKLRYTQLEKSNYYLSCSGDVLIYRVGKNCGKHIILSEKDEGLLVSDCLLIIRVTEEKDRKELLGRLEKISFSHLIKGVTTKYITHKDVKQALNG